MEPRGRSSGQGTLLSVGDAAPCAYRPLVLFLPSFRTTTCCPRGGCRSCVCGARHVCRSSTPTGFRTGGQKASTRTTTSRRTYYSSSSSTTGRCQNWRGVHHQRHCQAVCAVPVAESTRLCYRATAYAQQKGGHLGGKGQTTDCRAIEQFSAAATAPSVGGICTLNSQPCYDCDRHLVLCDCG